jgi:hypothetical protein
VLWCSELQCGGLESREFFSDVMACGHGSLVVCRGCFVYQVETGWVGLDRVWVSFMCVA